MEASAEGIRALWISLAVLAGTAVLQAVVVAVSGSVALLGDTLHNAADALTAVPLGIAFVVGRRPPTRRYTYGYSRAEDLAGVMIVVIIAASSALAAYEAITRLAHPRPGSNLAAVAAAAVIGFTGNELVARYRITVGHKIGSAALVADGLHARTDGFTSLVLLRATPGVLGTGQVRLPWIGHNLRAECEVIVDAGASAVQAHRVAVGAEHAPAGARRSAGPGGHRSPRGAGVTPVRRSAMRRENPAVRMLAGLVVAAAALFAAGCTAGTGRMAAPAASLPPDPHTSPALLKIAAAFNHDYDTGDYGPVYTRWDHRSQAIITRADYITRHKDCPSGSHALSQTETVSPGPHGAWLVYYEIGGQQLTDYWFYVHRRWVFDLMLSNPDAVKLYRLSPQQYAAALGCNH